MAPGELSLQHFRSLRATLEALPSGNVDVQSLKAQLERSRPAFRAPLQLPKPGEAGSSADLDKGWLTPYGTSSRWNITGSIDHFKQEVANVSGQLNVSERYAASLIALVLGGRRPLADRPQDDNVIYLYYGERRDWLVCLQLLFAYLSDPEYTEALETSVQDMLRTYASDLVTWTDGQSRTWIRILLDEIDRQDTVAKSIPGSNAPNNVNTQSGPSGTISARFSDELCAQQREAHTQERRLLANILYGVAAAGGLFSAKDSYAFITKCATKDSQDLVTPVLAATLLAVLSGDSTLAHSSDMLRDAGSFVMTGANWKLSPLQPLAKVAWCLFLCQMNGGFSHTIRDVRVEEILKDSMYSAFDLCTNGLLYFKKPANHLEDICWTAGSQISSQSQMATVEASFEDSVVRELDAFVEAIIFFCMKPLKEVRYVEEDPRKRPSGAHSRSRRLSVNSTDARPTPPHPSTVEALFNFITLLYKDRANSTLKFWEPNSSLLSFLRWAATSHDDRLRSLFDMLATMATGDLCAGEAFIAFTKFSDGQTASRSLFSQSWLDLFFAFESSANELSNLRSQQDATEVREQLAALKAFLRLVRNTATHSPAARAYFNGERSVMTIMFRFIVNPTYLELKAALLDTLRALAIVTYTQDALPGPAGTAALRQLWTLVEDNQLIATRSPGSNTSNAPTAPMPLSVELEMVEPRNRSYGGTTALVSLLTAMIGGTTGLNHDVSINAASRRLQQLESAQKYIPPDLGAPQRAASRGVESYTVYVIDTVLLRAVSRDYEQPAERWSVMERCLAYVERALAGLHLEAYVPRPYDGDNQSHGHSISILTIHPGYDIITRLLSGSPLLQEIIRLSSCSLAELDASSSTSSWIHLVLRALRILERTFAMQELFLEVILPILEENAQSLSSAQRHVLRQIKPLDLHMLYNSPAIADIAVLVNSTRSKAIGLTVVRIMSYLSNSTSFNTTDIFKDVYKTKINRLAGLIDASNEGALILKGFVDRLAGDPAFDDSVFTEDDASATPQTASGIDTVIKLSIMDLLLINTQPGREAPNVAHFLLGFKLGVRMDDLQIVHANNSTNQPVSCLNVVLDYLERIYDDTVGAEADQALPNILSESPLLGEKLYRLVRQLCMHEYTSQAMNTYMRSRQQFLRQSAVLPLPIPSSSGDVMGTVTYADGSLAHAAVGDVVATLQASAWILETLALELSNLADKDLPDQALRLLASLYGTTSDNVDPDLHKFGGSTEQGLPRMIEIFTALDFSWKDSITINSTSITQPFSEIPFHVCLREVSSGCEVYDITAVRILLGSARELYNSHNSQQRQEDIDDQERAILENLVIENNRREVEYARTNALKAWRIMLDITLTRASSLLPAGDSSSLFLDLLDLLLPNRTGEDLDSTIYDILTGAALLVMGQLRQANLRQQAGKIPSGAGLAPERLLPVLHNVVRAIIRPGLTSSVRGNLYAILLQFLHLSSSPLAVSSSVMAHDGPELSLSEFPQANLDGGLTGDGSSTVGSSLPATSKSPFAAGMLAFLQSSLERLLPVVCLDASSGPEVWQTVAYTVLDGLCRLAGRGMSGSRFASVLSKQGYVHAFVQSIRDNEAQLLSTLMPDPESLNALYVYEAKVAFLTRLAATKEGAERLLDARVLICLSHCSFFDIDAYARTDAMEYDAFVPPLLQRSHQILLPALQLAAAVAMRCGSTASTAARQILALLLAQRDALRGILFTTAATPTLQMLQEARLITQLMRTSLSVVSQEELYSPTGFGGLHSALLSLSSVVMAEQDWLESVQPSNAEELAETQLIRPDANHPTTVFRQRLTEFVESLQMCTLEYMRDVTKQSGSSVFQPVWLPSLRLDDSPTSRPIAPLPNLRSAMVFLSDTTSTMSARIQQLSEVNFRISNFDDTSLADLDLYDMFEDAEDEVSDEYARRIGVLTTLRNIGKVLRHRALSSIHLAELSLLLLWRHISHFLNEGSAQQSHHSSSRPQIDCEAPRAATTRFLPFQSYQEVANLRADGQGAFGVIASQFDDFSLDKSQLGPEARTHEALVTTLVRSILDLLASPDTA